MEGPPDEAERCPECGGDEIEVISIRDRFHPMRRPNSAGQVARPVARSHWLTCRSCGNTWFVIRKLED